MKYEIESIKKVEVNNDQMGYTAFDIVLKKPVNGLGCATVPAKTKEEAISTFETLLVNHTVLSVEDGALDLDKIESK